MCRCVWLLSLLACGPVAEPNPDPADVEAAGVDVDLDDLSAAEEAVYRTDPGHWDTDRDGGADGWEVSVGANPLAADAWRDHDSDGDGAWDALEVWLGRNPNFRLDDNEDADGDGVPDEYDWKNPRVVDMRECDLPTSWYVVIADDPDLDCLDSYWERRSGTDPLNPDSDGDGWTDGYEVALAKLLMDGCLTAPVVCGGSTPVPSPVDPDFDDDGCPDGRDPVWYGSNWDTGGLRPCEEAPRP